MVPEEGVHMPRRHPPYPPEFRAEAVRLVRSGERIPEQLSRDLGCSARAIRDWVRQADLDVGRRNDGLTTAEREELGRLRRENRVLREEREILRKAAAFFETPSRRHIRTTEYPAFSASMSRKRLTGSSPWRRAATTPGGSGRPQRERVPMLP
jgi:transposase